MSLTRSLARPMLAAVFVTSGIDVLRNPGPRVAAAEPVAPELAAKLGLPQDTELLVRVNAATHLVAGGLLAIGKLRRLSALALMASLVPTTYAGHRFWETDDPKERAQHQAHFLKNLAVMGGLLLEVVDTEGRPSVGWRSRRAAGRAAAAASGPVARTAAAAAKGAAAAKLVGAAQDAATARAAKGIAEAAGKAKAASVLTDKAAGLAKSAAKADVVVGAAGKATKLARKAAKAEVVAEGATRARDLAGTAAKLKVSKEVAERAFDALDMAKAKDLAGKAVAAAGAAHRAGD
jgi:putative oxidoreductase